MAVMLTNLGSWSVVIPKALATACIFLSIWLAIRLRVNVLLFTRVIQVATFGYALVVLWNLHLLVLNWS